MVEILILNQETAPYFTGLTFPNYAPVLESFSKDTHVAVGAATEDGEPIGLVLAFRSERPDRPNELLSIYVDDEYHNEGIGTQLLLTLQRNLISLEHPHLIGRFANDLEHAPALLRVFEKCGCTISPHELFTLTMPIAIAYERMPSAPLPADYRIGSFADCTEDDLDQIAVYLQDSDNNGAHDIFADIGVPTHADSSVVLYYQDHVVGWMINHEIRAGVIRYSRLFIAPEYRQKQLAICIGKDSIRRQYELLPDSLLIFSTEKGNSPMARMIAYFQDHEDVTFTRNLTMVWKGETATASSP